MTASNQIKMNALPSTPSLLLRAAITRKSPGKMSPAKPPVFPDTVITVDNINIDTTQLQRYRQVCGFATHSPYLPMSFLHVLAFRLQLAMMLRKEFPVAPMGMVHLSNTLRQYRPIEATEKPSLRCRISDSWLSSKGVEFTFICSAYIGQDKVWEDESLYLTRMKTGIAKDKTERPALQEFEHREPWQLCPEQARQYAKASGDYNPIHLHNLSAKLLGFKKMIIHGMWSQAACISALEASVGERSECYAEFKTPVFLPATLQFCHQQSEQGIDFGLRNESGDKPHVEGYFRPLA